MVFITENVPFSLSIGLDLSLNEDYDYDNALTYITTLQEINIDYIVSPISKINQDLRRNVSRIEKTLNNSEIKKVENINFDKPIFINDFQMKFFYWKNKFISKIHVEDLEDIPKNFDIISQDLNYANYINSKSSVLEIDIEKIFMSDKPSLKLNKHSEAVQKISSEKNETFEVNNKFKMQNEFYLVKLIKQFFAENIGRHLTVMLEFTKDNYYFYSKLQSQVNNIDNFEVLLKLNENLPDEVKQFMINFMLFFLIQLKF